MSNNFINNITSFFHRLDEKIVLSSFFILFVYGFFVFGIENDTVKLLIRVFIVLLFLFFIYFRFKRVAVSQEKSYQSEYKFEKKDEGDIEVIRRLAEQFHIKKEINPEFEFELGLNKILGIVNSTFMSTLAIIYLIDKKKNAFVPRKVVSESEENSKMKEILTESKVVNEVFERKEIIINDEISEEERNTFFEEGGLILKSFLGSPIFIENEVIGLLAIFSNAKGAYGDDDKGLIRGFSEIVSMVIINYNNVIESETSSLLFSSFYEISKGLNSNLKFDEIVNMLINIVKKIFEYDRISLSFVDDDGYYARIKRVVGQTDEFKEGYRFTLDEGLNGWVIRKNRPITVANLEKGDYFIPRYSKSEKNNYGIKSFLSAPIGYYNRCLGAITIEGKKENLYGERHENVLVMLANNIGAALERSIIYQKLETEAITDELTGLNNYRAFRLKLYDEINRAKRYKQKFCLLMMDIDKFKDFNDRYGHLLGDQILKAIGKSIESSLRNIDFVARYGGEEFVAIIITTDIIDAELSAERLRKTIDSTRYKFDSSEYHITLSIGVAEYPGSSQSGDDLINKADQALYQAKAAGRNKVVVYED